MKDWIVGAFIVGAVAVGYQNNTESQDGCSRYASKFNCDYVVKQAQYDVYYWRYLDKDNNEKYVGSTIGLASCRDTAINAHIDTNVSMRQELEWSDRMYICMLKKDGRSLEKHRWIG